MKESLGTFMMVAAVAVIMITLILGVSYDGLVHKHNKHEDLLKTEHQLEKRNIIIGF